MLSDRVLLFSVGSSSGCFLECRESIHGGSGTAFLAVMLQETATAAPIRVNGFAVTLNIAKVELPAWRFLNFWRFSLWRAINGADLCFFATGGKSNLA